MFGKYKVAFIAASYVLAIIASGFGYWFCFDRAPGPPDFTPGEWQISERTAGGVGVALENYNREIGELEKALEITNGKLIAALTAQLYAPAVEETIIADEIDGRLEWGWERPFGGGSAVADFPTRQVDMTFNEYYIDFAVEIGKLPEPDGRLFATVAVDDEYLILNETKFYAEPPERERWYNKFNSGVAFGYGDGLTVLGTAGWSGYNFYVTRDRAGETYMFGKSIEFF